MKRTEYYSTALRNLGLFPFLHFELTKRIPHSEPYLLRSQYLDRPVLVRPGTSDLSVFYEVLVMNEYRCVASLPSPKLIVDLGANVGYSAAYFLSQFKGCEVIAVEPAPENFAALEENVAPYGDRVATIKAAVWPRSERLALTHPGQGEEWGITVAPAVNGGIET